MKSFSTLALAVLLCFLSSCQKELVAPLPITGKDLICGEVSTCALVCNKSKEAVGKVSVSNTADIVYVKIENISRFTNSRILMKEMGEETSIVSHNFVHAEGTRDHMYAFKNNYKPGASVAVLVEVNCVNEEIASTTSPFVLHRVQACN